jgi:uncharacterized phage protein (TIGR02218 family)
MRRIPDGLAKRLGGATTLCHCWRLALRDGARIGFTDHDRDLVFDGLTHAAASGLDATEVEASLGFASVGAEVSGALTATGLNETDLASGRYDGATLETWLVDWDQTDARLLLDIAVIGEVSRRDEAFSAEVRSLAQSFDEPRGRLYQVGCSADLGDARCKVGLTAAPMRVSVTLLSAESASVLRLTGTGLEDGWFCGGGLYSGARRLGVVREHAERNGQTVVTLWTRLSSAPRPGESLALVAGCDKSFETCRAKFGNHLNFRGFPHMPGNDRMLSYVKAGDVGMDGGSLFR